MHNLAPFSLYVLLLPTLTIFLFGLWLTYVLTRWPLASLFVAAVKSGVFLVYYSLLFNGTFTFVDDWKYLHRGEALLSQGVSVTNLFTHLPELFYQAAGQHFVYYLYNADCFRLFGAAYYSPVAMNVILSFIAADAMVTAVKRQLGFTKKQSAGLFVFITLHPDIVAWSTIMNGKDILIMTGVSVATYAVSLLERKKYRSALLVALMVGLVLFFTRFYIPLLLASALVISISKTSSHQRRITVWLLAITLFFGALWATTKDGLEIAYSNLQQNFVNPLYGVPRMFLTPAPFRADEAYAFLTMPQLFHWALAPVLLYGLYHIQRKATLLARFVVVYFLLALLLYGIFEELQGPRHRVQLDGLIALFQFCGILELLKHYKSTTAAKIYLK